MRLEERVNSGGSDARQAPLCGWEDRSIIESKPFCTGINRNMTCYELPEYEVQWQLVSQQDIARGKLVDIKRVEKED